MEPIRGVFDGDEYEVVRFPGGAYVQRPGGERHAVSLKPPSCCCGDFIWRREGLLPVPCRHVLAARKLIQETIRG